MFVSQVGGDDERGVILKALLESVSLKNPSDTALERSHIKGDPGSRVNTLLLQLSLIYWSMAILISLTAQSKDITGPSLWSHDQRFLVTSQNRT